MSEAQGEAGKQKLPGCRGRHPHLAAFDRQCPSETVLMMMGASNLWFATQSVIVMPRSDQEEQRAFLTAFEADRLAMALRAGDTTARALREVHPTRRGEAHRLLADADLGPHRVDVSAAVLQAIAGGRSVRGEAVPVWTMPGPSARIGRLTSEAQRLVDHAPMSVVCSSFNFSPHSRMWTALRDASAAPVAAHLPKATVYLTRTLPGETQPLVSHAKFIVVDRTVTLLTSANFSYRAENTKIKLGLLVHDAALAESIEATMRDRHGVLYERVERR